MNATFMSAVRANGGPGSDIRTASGTIPGHVHPPADSSADFRTSSLPQQASTLGDAANIEPEAKSVR